MTLKNIWMDSQKWIEHRFGKDELTLFISVIVLFTTLHFLSNSLAPVFAAIVIAYLLDGIVKKLEQKKVPHLAAVLITYNLALSLFLVVFIGLFPLIWQQAHRFFLDLPNTIVAAQNVLAHLSEHYSQWFSFEQMKAMLADAKVDFAKLGQTVVSFSVASIPSFFTALVYFVLVPFLVYFFLADQKTIINWCNYYLPPNRRLLNQVWMEIHEQIGNYIRGRVVEMMIVSLTCYIAFRLLNLNYALLLAVSVGVSTFVPFIGAIVVTIPVVTVGLWQWGLTMPFLYLVIVYSAIILIDANVLVPIVFSEAVSLHPVVIMIALLLFGKLWGFWGIFFAIPLAVVLKATLNAISRAP